MMFLQSCSIFILACLVMIAGQKQCCQLKTVTDAPDPSLNGQFTLQESLEDKPDPFCLDGCIYTKQGGEDNYCFRQVPLADAAKVSPEECEASSTTNPITTGAAGPSTAGPTGTTTIRPEDPTTTGPA